MTQRCYNCSRLGHLASKCPEPQRQQGSYCKGCGSRSHLERSCPQIWRLYLPSAAFEPDGNWEVTAWCYNCASEGHYGDDCPQPHRARLIESSAFCRANQPESRNQKRQRESGEQRAAQRYKRFDEEERQADWFIQHSHSRERPTESRFDSRQNGKFHHDHTVQSFPPVPGGPRRTRQEGRYDPYARPAPRGPIITSEKYPRGLPVSKGSSQAPSSQPSPQEPRKRVYDKRKPVPAAQRLAAQNQIDNHTFRGGKAYRGGGRR